ncbi:MAG: ketopantoate reductase family protein [Candidatus Bathyarchaeia archaeon]
MSPPETNPHVIVVGAGAIGLSVAGWIFPHCANLHLLARGESVSVIRSSGLRAYQKGHESKNSPMPLKVIESLDEAPPPDVMVITVKNYDLDRTAQTLKSQLGSLQPIVVAVQNGVENQQILPKYFSRVVYGVICYNAWRNGVGVVEYAKRGHIIIGTPRNNLQPELQIVKDVLSLGLTCTITDRLRDAAHCKLALNLINALLALVGLRKREIKSYKTLIHIATRILWEGIQVLQAAGIKEHELGTLPSWKDVQVAMSMPESLKNPFYAAIVNGAGPWSMTQDIFGGKSTTELESLNGYMLTLARKVGVPMPINQVIYDIAKERFRPDFQPIDEADLWQMVNDRVNDRQFQLTRSNE